METQGEDRQAKNIAFMDRKELIPGKHTTLSDKLCLTHHSRSTSPYELKRLVTYQPAVTRSLSLGCNTCNLIDDVCVLWHEEPYLSMVQLLQRELRLRLANE